MSVVAVGVSLAILTIGSLGAASLFRARARKPVQPTRTANVIHVPPNFWKR